MTNRAIARDLATAAIRRGRPLEWFEELYRLAESDNVSIPWADLRPNPNLIDLVKRLPVISSDARALKVGCGLGDDAEWLASCGWQTTAFDIAPSAIAKCLTRFPNSAVTYKVADLFAPPPEWDQAFEIVQESYTLQVLPPELRIPAIERIARFVKPGGQLLVIARARSPDEPLGSMPWPLTESEINHFTTQGLTRHYFREYTDAEDPPVKRIQACFTRRPQTS